MANLPRPAKVYQPPTTSTRATSRNSTAPASTQVKSNRTTKTRPVRSAPKKKNNLFPPKNSRPPSRSSRSTRLTESAAETDAIEIEKDKRFRPPPINPAQLELIRQSGIIAAIVLLVLGVLIVLFTSFKVQTVDCRFEGELCSPELQQTLAAVKEENLFFHRFDQQILALPQLNNQLSRVTVEKQLPQTLQVELMAAPVLYQLLIDDQLLTMNTNLILQDRALPSHYSQGDLPPIKIEYAPLREQIKNENRLSAFYHQAFLDLVKAIKRADWQDDIKSITLQEDEKLVVTLQNGQQDLQVILDQTEPEASTQKLTYLKKNLPPSEWQTYQLIDLRFKSPIGLKPPS